MDLKQIIEQAEKEFDKQFKDITHFGCPATKEIPCGTLKDDINDFLSSQISKAVEEVVREILKVDKRLVSAGLEEMLEMDGKKFIEGYKRGFSQRGDYIESNLKNLDIEYED